MQAHDLPLIRIAPTRGWASLDLGGLWEYRELLFFMVWRDIKVRYKQTLLGAAWAIIQPLFTMIVFTVFFGRLAQVPSDGVPYPVFAFVALLPWTFFASGVAQASNSLVGAANLIRKVYFPRLAMPIAAILSGLLDLLIAFVVLVGLMAYYGIAPSARLALVPAFVLFATMAALGAGLILSALNVQFRDIRHAIPFLIQFWLFATPIAYPSSLISPPWRTLYGLNPMVGVVEGFRWALLGTDSLTSPMLLVSVLTAVVLLIFGALYFRRMERQFADVI